MADQFEDTARAIRERIAAQGFMKLVGADLSTLERGAATISVGRRPELLLADGVFHGGVTAFLVDNGTSIAAATTLRDGQTCLAAEYKLNMLAPARGDRLICRARVVRAGRLMAVVAADVFCATDGQEVQTALAIATVTVAGSGSLGEGGDA